MKQGVISRWKKTKNLKKCGAKPRLTDVFLKRHLSDISGFFSGHFQSFPALEILTLSRCQNAAKLSDAISAVVDVTLRLEHHVHKFRVIFTVDIYVRYLWIVSMIQCVNASTPGGATFDGPPICLGALQTV